MVVIVFRARLRDGIDMARLGAAGARMAELATAMPGMSNEAWVDGRVVVQLVLWDDPDEPAPMDAGMTPQASVNDAKGTPADCDLTIVALWSRIGSPPALLRDDGSRYASGAPAVRRQRWMATAWRNTAMRNAAATRGAPRTA